MRPRTSCHAAAACAAALTSFLVATPRATAGPSAGAPHALSERLQARSDLPPGESGYFPITSQATYELDHDPTDFGPHVDDQRTTYWDFKTKPDDFARPTGTPVEPRSGVRIYRDAQGVPLIYGKTGYDVWYGAGYAAAVDRLFEMDAIRRTAEGTLAELVGASSVPADLHERTLTYTSGEYTRMYRRLSPAGRQAIAGYAAGVEARIKQVRANPALLPGEYAVLTTEPVAWTIDDTMAAGVYITRDIASQGGQEMGNVAILRQLERRHGRRIGRRIFSTLFPENDPKAATTLHGVDFSNLPRSERSSAAQHAAFVQAANLADHLPLALAHGPGTGDSPVPGSSSHLSRSRGGVPPAIRRVDAEVRRAVRSIESWTGALHGGSFGYAISGSRTRSGHAMLVSNPQLSYSYPSELYELEVHGGGYDARGVGVPGLPTVGIGHTASVAWALTTGYSKTIDSFIETTRPNPRKGGPPQYLHDGRWHDESCRMTDVKYRPSVDGVPVGPASLAETARICRTDHGPVVASTAGGRRSRSVDYAMWEHEDQTVEGILDWDRAKTLRQLASGVRRVTWNENVIAADADGNIGYWHPGRYFRRAPGTDQRFPLVGTGRQDERGFLPFTDMPHVVNPSAGYVANWNTKPAKSWVDGDLSGTTTRPAGPANRIRVIQTILAASHHLTASSLTRIDRRIGESDDRYLGYRPVLRNLATIRRLNPLQRRARALLEHFDGLAYDPGVAGGSSPLGTAADKVTDGPAATLFTEFTAQIKRQLFGHLSRNIRMRLNNIRLLAQTEHQYDVTPLDNDALRVLVPHFSGVRSLPRWADGRSALSIERAALAGAVRALVKRYGARPSGWRRAHAISPVDSLSGVVGPSVQMPFEDRGTWVQEVAFSAGPRRG